MGLDTSPGGGRRERGQGQESDSPDCGALGT